MSRYLIVTALLLFLLPAAGCMVSEADYEELASARDSLQDELAKVRAENELLQKEIVDLYKEHQEYENQLNDCQMEVKNLNKDLAKYRADDPAAGGIPRVYIVEPGDTLSGIASATGVSSETIRKLNNLHTTTVYVGQKLKLKE